MAVTAGSSGCPRSQQVKAWRRSQHMHGLRQATWRPATTTHTETLCAE
jgi:transcriptional regulator of acetoin/glycerol metabolism